MPTAPVDIKADSSWPLVLRRFAPVLIYTLATLAVFWRLWTPIDNAQRSWKYDPQHAYWGDLAFQERSLGEGEIALWNPYDRGGFPVYGDPQPGMFYPPNWPLILWGKLTGNVPFSLASFKILLHWIFGAFGMHLLIRRWQGRESACYVAGLLFSFTSPKLRYMGSALNWSVAWLPWVLLAIQWFSEAPSKKRAVLLGSAISMVLLSGAPAVVLYTLVLGIPVGLYLLWGRLQTHVVPIAIAAFTTLLWTLPLVACNLEQLPESVRQVRSYAFITDSVFTPGQFASFFVPHLGGENPYVGMGAVLAIGLAIASKQRGLAWVLVAIAGFSVAISLGNHAGILPATASAVPPFSLFRRAHRYLYITSLAIACLGGLGISHALSLQNEAARKRLARIVTFVGSGIAGVICVAYLVSLVINTRADTPKSVGLGMAFPSSVVFTLALRYAIAGTTRVRLVAGWALPLLLFFDIWTANHRYVDLGMTALPSTTNDALVTKLEGVERDWRVYDEDFLGYRPGTRLGIRDLSGYEDDPLGLSRYKAFLKAAARDTNLMGHANVRYFLDGDRGKLSPPKGAKQIESKIWELTNVAPAVYYVPAPLVAKNQKEAQRLLSTFPPGTQAVVEGKVPSGPQELSVTTGQLTRLTPNRVTAEIDTPGPGVVVIAEAYYSKWTATLDGSPTTIVPANLLFRGIPVATAGHHVIDMRLKPMGFWGLLPSYVVAFVLFVWAALPEKNQRKGATST